jgi:hypothetical protein
MPMRRGPPPLSLFLFLIGFLPVAPARASRAQLADPGPAAVDCTVLFREFLDRPEDTLIIPPRPGGWSTGPVILRRSRKTLILLPGVEWRALPGAFPKAKNCLLSLKAADDVSLAGYGARLCMNKAEYREGEWRHALSLRACRRVSILGLAIDSSGGDGIMIGSNRQPGRDHCENILIRDCALSGHRRQGISVISAQDVSIERTYIGGTEGTPPACGIDFEPDRPEERLVRCRVIDCIFDRNDNAAFLVFLGALGPESEPVSIEARGCLFARSVKGPGIQISGFRKPGVRGRILFSHCGIEGNSGPAILIHDKGPDDPAAAFDSISLDGSVVLAHSENSGPLGGVSLHALAFAGRGGRRPMEIRLKGKGPVQSVSLAGWPAPGGVPGAPGDEGAWDASAQGVPLRRLAGPPFRFHAPPVGRFRARRDGTVGFLPFLSARQSQLQEISLRPGTCASLRDASAEFAPGDSVCLPSLPQPY